MNSNNVALVVEDDANSASAIARVVASLGYETVIAGTLELANVELNRRSPALVFLDIGLPDGNGLDLVENFNGPNKPHFIVITGNDSKEVVINSLRAEATDFLQKPVSLNELKSCVRRLTSKTATALEAADQLPPLNTSDSVAGNGTFVFQGKSKAVTELKSHVSNCAKSQLDTIVSGAVGVDKLGVAYAIHEQSKRSGKYLCIEASDFEINAFNSSAGSASADLNTLIRSWFELATQGTLIITDLSSIPLAYQRLLTRILGRKPTMSCKVVGSNVQPSALLPRVIGLLNEPWEQAVENGRLVPEFYHRLAQYSIRVPKLVDRIADVEQMATVIVDALNKGYQTRKVLANESRERMKRYGWPGNLTELQNVLTQGFASSVQTIVLDPGLMPIANDDGTELQTIDSLVGKSFWQVEKTLLFATLEHHNGDKVKTAKSLGISLKTLYNRLNAYS